MNKLLVLAVVASVVTCSTAQYAHCAEDLNQCEQTLLNNVLSYTTEDQACEGFKTFISCVEDACGDIPPEDLQRVQNALDEQGYHCSISGTAAPSISLLLVPIMAALPAVIGKLW